MDKVHRKTALVKNLKARISQLGTSAKRASLDAGLSDAFIKDIYSGRKHSPSLANLTKVAAVLQCSVSDLIGASAGFQSADDQQSELTTNTQTNTALINNLKAKIAEKRMSARSVAIAAGFGETYVRDIYHGKTNSPTAANLAKIAKVLNCTIADLTGEAAGIQTVKVVGQVEAGTYREVPHGGDDDLRELPYAQDVRSIGEALFAYEVRDKSADKLFKPGAFLICTNVDDTGATPRSGQMVIAERTDGEGKKETTVKEYRKNPDGTRWLISHSTQTRYSAPISLDEFEEVKVHAILVADLRLWS